MQYDKCPRCKTYRLPNQFLNAKGRKLKTCDICRERGRKNAEKNKCEHNRKKAQCKECGGSQICIHNRHKGICKKCMTTEECILYIKKIMVNNSRKSDKKIELYDANNHIDVCFLDGLFEDYEKCPYCDVEFTYGELCKTFVTIERKDNSIGHTKANCILCCYSCNCKKISNIQ